MPGDTINSTLALCTTVAIVHYQTTDQRMGQKLPSKKTHNKQSEEEGKNVHFLFISPPALQNAQSKGSTSQQWMIVEVVQQTPFICCIPAAAPLPCHASAVQSIQGTPGSVAIHAVLFLVYFSCISFRSCCCCYYDMNSKQRRHQHTVNLCMQSITEEEHNLLFAPSSSTCSMFLLYVDILWFNLDAFGWRRKRSGRMMSSTIHSSRVGGSGAVEVAHIFNCL